MAAHAVTLTNWARTETATPAFYHEPCSVAEVAATLRAASLRGSTLRVLGAGHSPSACAMAHGPGCEMLSLRRLCSVHSIDATSGEVDVDAGITLAALGLALRAAGLALPNLGSIDAQQLGGCIATGTHGTGIRDGTLSSCVTALTLVTAGGALREVAAGDPLLPAALCSLGLLGVVVRVRLRAVPAFHLRVREGPEDLDELLRSLPARIASARFYRFFWFPHTNRAWEWRADPVPPPPPPPPPAGGALAAAWRALRGAVADAAAWLRDRLLGFHALEAALWLSLRAPRLLVPTINAAWGAALFSSPRAATVRADAVGGFTFDCLFQQHVSEWAVPVAALPAVMRSLRELLAGGADLVGHFPVEVRFSAGDDLPLSPAQGRATAWVGIIAYKPYGEDRGGHVRYFAAFERVVQLFAGRPHWAKAFGSIPLRTLYPQWDAFFALREALDPGGLFLNEWARHVLHCGRLSSRADSGAAGERGTPAGAEADAPRAAHQPPPGDNAVAWREVEAPRVRAGEPPPPWTDAAAWARRILSV